MVFFAPSFHSMLFAGQFTVTPIKLQFDQKSRSGVVNVFNEEKNPLQIQMKAYVWTQDANGKDQYTETKDLLFFPKMATINPNQERLIRVGIKNPSLKHEKTYRLFIEEIPTRVESQTETQVQVAIRFGVPIFVTPPQKAVSGNVQGLGLGKGQLQMSIQNNGNTHFIIQSIMIRGRNQSGEEHFSKELSGWYLLTGSSRAYETNIPIEACRQATAFDVEVKTSEFVLSEKFNVEKSLCTP